MPLPLAALIPLIAAGVGGAATIGSAISGRKTSIENTEKTIAAQKELAQYQYQQEMSQLEYMNQYNTPAAQKQRLIDAGLNPALMYEGQPQNTQTQLPKYNAPEIEYKYEPVNVQALGSMISQYQDARIKNVQVDNLKAQQDNVKMDTALKAAQQGKQLAETAKSKFDLELAKEMKAYSLDIMQTKTFSEWADYLNKIQDWNLKEQDINIKKIERQLRKEDLQLRKRGIYPGDPVYIRTILQNIPELKGILQRMQENPLK